MVHEWQFRFVVTGNVIYDDHSNNSGDDDAAPPQSSSDPCTKNAYVISHPTGYVSIQLLQLHQLNLDDDDDDDDSLRPTWGSVRS